MSLSCGSRNDSEIQTSVQVGYAWRLGTTPTTVNAEILRGLHHPNWDIEVLPSVDHGLFENPSGLEPDEAKATRLATGLRDLLAAWLARTVGPSP